MIALHTNEIIGDINVSCHNSQLLIKYFGLNIYREEMGA
jgi:hypothetical protein